MNIRTLCICTMAVLTVIVVSCASTRPVDKDIARQEQADKLNILARTDRSFSRDLLTKKTASDPANHIRELKGSPDPSKYPLNDVPDYNRTDPLLSIQPKPKDNTSERWPKSQKAIVRCILALAGLSVIYFGVLRNLDSFSR